MDNTVVKIVRDDSKTFRIGSSEDWRFGKNGLDSFGEFKNEITYNDNGVGDGGYISSTRMGDIDRSITAVYSNPSMNESARRMASSFFNPKHKYNVYVTYGGRTRWAEGVIHKFNLGTSPSISSLLKLTVTFDFPNPYWKSYDNFGHNIASINGMAGFPYISRPSIGFTTGIYNFAKKVLINNNGDIETFCTAVFTAKDSVTNPKLILNDSYVRVIDTMEEGDVIEMDFTAMPPTVKKNGVNFIGHCDRTSSFDEMKIIVGDSDIEYDADDGSDHLEVYVYYNQLYASV